MKNPTLLIYRDDKKQFRWTLIARNGRKLANGGEGYQRRRSLDQAICLLHGIVWAKEKNLGDEVRVAGWEVRDETQS